MENLEIGRRYNINCYKHDGKIHKIWEEAILLDVVDEYIVFANENIRVTAADGRKWITKEPSIMFFFKNHWYNVTARIKEDGNQYKCDIASPYIIENDIIKYIDYDLDLKIFTNGAFKILDRGEYNYHKTKMNYPKEIDWIIKEELTFLINEVKNKKFPFNTDDIKKYFDLYKEIKSL